MTTPPPDAVSAENMSLTNYTVTRETLGGLVEVTELQYARPYPAHDRWYYIEDGGREVEVADSTNTGWGFHLSSLTWFILAEIEREGWDVACVDKRWFVGFYLDPFENEPFSFSWDPGGFAPTLPEAFLAAKRAQMEGKG